jgi:hypothetical protein
MLLLISTGTPLGLDPHHVVSAFSGQEFGLSGVVHFGR